jgi:hypothetical protein
MHTVIHFRAPANLTAAIHPSGPRSTLNFAADLNHLSRRQGLRQFDPQTAATEVDQRYFGVIHQKPGLCSGGARSAKPPTFAL